MTTPPLSDGCLDGITRQSVITLLESDGVEVKEQSISPEELLEAEELFFTGTAAEVTPIRAVDDKTIGEPGPVTRRAQKLFNDAVGGKLDGFSDWLTYI